MTISNNALLVLLLVMTGHQCQANFIWNLLSACTQSAWSLSGSNLRLVCEHNKGARTSRKANPAVLLLHRHAFDANSIFWHGAEVVDCKSQPEDSFSVKTIEG